jgi:hypothetical protein
MATLREDLEKAVKDAGVEGVEEPVLETPSEEAPPEEKPDEAPEEKPDETPEEKEERARDEEGRFAKEKKARIAKEEKAAKATEEKPAPEPKEAKPAADLGSKAPQSWKPLVREEWAKVPPSVQQEVLKREREVQVALQESSEARQTHQKFREAVAPYEAMIRSEGAEPLQAVGALLRDAAMLRMAPIPVRAQAIARMIHNFLPREGWAALDAALAGQMGGEAPPQGQPPAQGQMRDPRVDELLARIDQSKAANEQEAAAQATAEYEKISQLEFFDDVRQDMADIMEVRARRGVAITPMEAYTLAVRQNPQTGSVLEQREAAKRASQQPTTRRAAASSIRSAPRQAPVGRVDGGDDLRGDIEAAVEQVSGR